MHSIDVITCQVAWWMVSSDKFWGVNISDIYRDWASVDFVQPHLVSVMLVAWSPPRLGLLKLNFDGNCVQELDLAGYGDVIRNISGESMISFAGPFPNGSVLEVELYSLWRGF